MSLRRLSVSTWSLHNTLGRPEFYGVGTDSIPTNSHDKGEVTLLNLPKALADFGITTLELPHFHLPSTDDRYLAEFSQALKNANVELFSVLIDDGDITHPTDNKVHTAWIGGWLDVAKKLGSTNARVIAGKQEIRKETLELSKQNLSELILKANNLGVGLMTENWFATASTPESLVHILDAFEGQLSLCLDFGNWPAPAKYEQFKAIAPFAKSCHAKASFENGHIDSIDYLKCLDILRSADFDGPFTLIYDDTKLGEWQGLNEEIKIVEDYL